MTIAHARTTVLLCAAALALSGCTIDDGAADDPIPATTARPDVTAEPTETVAPGPTVEAVIVVANIDVDGAHATASGYISGVIEDGGACTFVFTGEAGEVSASSSGAADRATTSCGSVSIPIEQLSKGTWSVQLEYESERAQVVSEESIVEVP